MTATTENYEYLFTEDGVNFAAWYDEETVQVVVKNLDTGEETRRVSFAPIPSVFRFTAECIASSMI